MLTECLSSQLSHLYKGAKSSKYPIRSSEDDVNEDLCSTWKTTGSFKKSTKQDAFSGLIKKCMRLLSHCTCCFPCLEILFSTPYSLLHSIAFLLRCPLLQEVLWLPRLWLAVLLWVPHTCAIPSAWVGMIWDTLGCPVSSTGWVLSSMKGHNRIHIKG